MRLYGLKLSLSLLPEFQHPSHGLHVLQWMNHLPIARKTNWIIIAKVINYVQPLLTIFMQLTNLSNTIITTDCANASTVELWKATYSYPLMQPYLYNRFLWIATWWAMQDLYIPQVCGGRTPLSLHYTISFHLFI